MWVTQDSVRVGDHAAKEILVRVVQHAFVVPTHGYSLRGTALDYVFCCVGDAALAGVYGEVAAAEEEAVDRVDGVPGSGVVEFNVACGVG